MIAEEPPEEGPPAANKSRLRKAWCKVPGLADISDRSFDGANKWLLWTAIAHGAPVGALVLIQLLFATVNLTEFVARGLLVSLALGLLISLFSSTTQSTKRSQFLHGAGLLLVAFCAIMVAAPDVYKDLAMPMRTLTYVKMSIGLYVVALPMAYAAQLLRFEYAEDVNEADYEETTRKRIKGLRDIYEEETKC